MNFLDPRLPDRFWSKVQPCPMSGCWIWTGAINESTGYGIVTRGTRSQGRTSVHRHAYETLVGPIPQELVSDHKCRVRVCCNPQHIEPVTQQVNTLRGDARFNGEKNRIKTHCPQGHAYDAANTYTHRGKRYCRECVRQNTRARRAQLKGIR
jgi:hypothetical protein